MKIPLYGFHLVKSGQLDSPVERIGNPSHVADLIRQLVCDQDPNQEHVVALFLSTKNQPVEEKIISGPLTAVGAREIYRAAILANAAAIIVVSARPDDYLTPLPEERILSNKLSEAGNLLGIELLDFIIVNPERHFLSFKEHGTLTMASTIRENISETGSKESIKEKISGATAASRQNKRQDQQRKEER